MGWVFHKQLFVEGRGSTGCGKTRAVTMLGLGCASYQGMPSGIRKSPKNKKLVQRRGLPRLRLICILPVAENVFPRVTPPLNRRKRLGGKEVGHGNSRLVPMPRC